MILNKWDNVGECSDFNYSPSFARRCEDIPGKYLGCVEVTNGIWYARTCTEVYSEIPRGCLNDTKYQSCFCSNNLCNSSFQIGGLRLENLVLTPLVVLIYR
ncbi:UNVERIFIED_CONTAM: hypothetical protein RMT77_009343 [Armadillidium vulgare]